MVFLLKVLANEFYSQIFNSGSMISVVTTPDPANTLLVRFAAATSIICGLLSAIHGVLLPMSFCMASTYLPVNHFILSMGKGSTAQAISFFMLFITLIGYGLRRS